MFQSVRIVDGGNNAVSPLSYCHNYIKMLRSRELSVKHYVTCFHLW
jgi:hypothetical protein